MSSKKESPKSERRQPAKMSEDGEKLAHCSDKEWEQSESAYSAELLNVKKKPNRVTVFAAPEKMVDTTGRSIRQMPQISKEQQSEGETDDRLQGLARLVTGVAKILLDDETAEGVEVTVNMKIQRHDKTQVSDVIILDRVDYLTTHHPRGKKARTGAEFCSVSFQKHFEATVSLMNYKPNSGNSPEQKAERMEEAISENNIIRISRIICDFLILVVCALPLLIFHEFVSPYKRGFYCDDESIRYPVVKSTVPREMLVVIGIIIPSCLIIGTEIFRAQAWEKKCADQFKTYRMKNYNVHRLIVRLYCFIGYFFLGICFNQLMVDIAKYTIGRQRPHFMDACKPNKGYTTCTNPDEYIADWECTVNNTKLTHEAQLSFYSGHAAFSFYAAWYTSLYLQARLYRPLFSRLLMPVIQFSLFGGAAYVALTRVSDYKHHWSDVLVGAIMGSTIGVFVALYVAEVFKRREIPATVAHSNDIGLIRMERRVDGPEVATHSVQVNNEIDGHHNEKDHANQRLVDSAKSTSSSSTQEARRQYFQAV